MPKLKLTKNELRSQEIKLKQLQRYLPTLQLKKAMLQAEVLSARHKIEKLAQEKERQLSITGQFATLLSDKLSIDPVSFAKVLEVKKTYENIAGVEVPDLQEVTFAPLDYSLFDTPPWVDGVIYELRKLTQAEVAIHVAQEKKRALEEELRQVSIRVNLFEKILIPRALKNIKKIKVFLGDQQLAAVGQVKVAKTKIEERKEAHLLALAKG